MRLPSPRAWWRAHCAQRDNRRLLDHIRRAGPAPQDGSPRVSYARAAMPGPGDKVAGGFVKCLDLHRAFPHHPDRFTLLYLVSSALPPEPLRWIDTARAIGARVVLNQNGVAYPAWHGPGWEAANAPLRAVRAAADFVVYQSDFSALSSDRFLGPFSAPSIRLHNPVDTAVFSPGPAVPPRPFHLLCAGSHLAFYRVQRAVETLIQLRQGGVEARLTLAGRYAWRYPETEARLELSDWLSTLPNDLPVEVRGAYSQAEGVELLRQSHLLIHPTVNDVCPRLVVEALACGVPVVYSATGGTPELVAPDAGIGVPGPLDWDQVLPPAAEDLARAAATVLASHAAYSASARHHAVEHLDVHPWLERHRALFAPGGLHA